MVRIVASRFGEVNGKAVDRVVEVMEECYGRLSPHGVTLVDLYVFERSSSLGCLLGLKEGVGRFEAAFSALSKYVYEACSASINGF